MKEPIALHSVPEKPGVYVMKDSTGEVLYVGKAKNLFLRLKTYFSQEGGDGRPQIPFLLNRVRDVETFVVFSEKEALLLEAKLIAQYKPQYNILLKEDTTEVRIHIDVSHQYPSIRAIRMNVKEIPPKESFGPFLSMHHASRCFDLIVRLFQLRQCSDEEFKRRVKPCLLYQLKQCTAPCVQAISREEYGAAVHKALDLLRGKDLSIQRRLKAEVKEASEQLEFEKASSLFKQLQLLESSLLELHVGKKKGASDSDVVYLFRSDSSCCLCVMHYRRSLLTSMDTNLFDRQEGQSVELDSLLIQYYMAREESSPPKEIILSEELQSKQATKEALSSVFDKPISLFFPQQGSKRELLSLAEENARLRLMQKRSQASSLKSLLQEMQEILSLEQRPLLIDCFDVSHLGGKGCVATCVSFKEGKPYKRRYRTYRLQGEARDDCGMMKEAILRRYRSVEEEMPDLILVDGGTLQLKAAESALSEVGLIATTVCALSKESARHDRGLTAEKIWKTGMSAPIILDTTSGVLHLLQRIRDEAHRFSITYQKKRRSAALFISQLDAIPNIGPKKKQRLLKAFSGIQAIKKASLEELQEKAGLSLADATRVQSFLS